MWYETHSAAYNIKTTPQSDVASRLTPQSFDMRTPVTTLGIALLALAGAAVCECPRSYLTAAAGLYIASQTAGQPSTAFANTSYVQNNKTMAMAAGILKTALKIDHNKTTVDTTACAAYVEVISTSPDPGHVIAAQIRTDQFGTPTLLDLIVTSKGDWQFNATKSLSIVTAENWAEIPAANRTTRAILKSVRSFLVWFHETG